MYSAIPGIAISSKAFVSTPTKSALSPPNRPRSSSKSLTAFEIKFIVLGWITKRELDSLIAEPIYRLPLYESTNVPREVRYLGDNLLAFRCKVNPVLSERIKGLGDAAKTTWVAGTFDNFGRNHGPSVALKPRFDWLHKVWIVPVYRFNLNAIVELIADQRFGMDQAASDYLKLARRSHNQPSIFAIDTENQIILANICDDPILAGWMNENGVKL
jgi:hypothetical protein